MQPHLLLYILTSSRDALYLSFEGTFWPTNHRRTPNEPVSLAKLRELGVLSWHLDADNHKTDPKLAAIRKVRGYTYEVRVDGVDQR